MRTTQIAQYALRLTYSQLVFEGDGSMPRGQLLRRFPASREKMMTRSALALAAIGLGLSTFSVRQMILHQSRRI